MFLFMKVHAKHCRWTFRSCGRLSLWSRGDAAWSQREQVSLSWGLCFNWLGALESMPIGERKHWSGTHLMFSRAHNIIFYHNCMVCVSWDPSLYMISLNARRLARLVPLPPIFPSPGEEDLRHSMFLRAAQHQSKNFGQPCTSSQ